VRALWRIAGSDGASEAPNVAAETEHKRATAPRRISEPPTECRRGAGQVTTIVGLRPHIQHCHARARRSLDVPLLDLQGLLGTYERVSEVSTAGCYSWGLIASERSSPCVSFSHRSWSLVSQRRRAWPKAPSSTHPRGCCGRRLRAGRRTLASDRPHGREATITAPSLGLLSASLLRSQFRRQ
jgi:hypothetical protein